MNDEKRRGVRTKDNPPRYRLHLNNGEVAVYHPTLPEPVSISEDEAGRRIVAHADLLAACKRFVLNAVCSCAEGGPGFRCDVCEGRGAIAKAEGKV